MRIRWLTAGESHGPGLVVVVEGMCAGVPIAVAELERDLAARREGAGRSPRQQEETDEFNLLAGVRRGITTGAPIAILLTNRVAAADGFVARAGDDSFPLWTVPRPGHADLAGALKRPGLDMRDVAERASARETAARTAAGAVAAALLEALGITVNSRVTSVGGIAADGPFAEPVANTPFGTGDKEAEIRIEQRVNQARQEGEGLGGIFEVQAVNVPAGLGDYTQWDRRLDGRLAQAMMSIPAVKAVEIGAGAALAAQTSTAARDPIVMRDGAVTRSGNQAGGIEGGVANGMPILVRAHVKPIPGVAAAVTTVDLATGREVASRHERHDTCVVRAAAVVGRAMTALVLADALLEFAGGDTLAQVEQGMRLRRTGK